MGEVLYDILTVFGINMKLVTLMKTCFLFRCSETRCSVAIVF